MQSIAFITLGLILLYNAYDNFKITFSYYTYTVTKPAIKCALYFIASLISFYIGIITY